NYPGIQEFLLKARDLKIVQSEKVGPSQWARLRLAPGQGSNSPVVLELKDAAGKPLRTLLLGKKHMKRSDQPAPGGEGEEAWPDGRYVRMSADSENVALIAD